MLSIYANTTSETDTQAHIITTLGTLKANCWAYTLTLLQEAHVRAPGLASWLSSGKPAQLEPPSSYFTLL